MRLVIAAIVLIAGCEFNVPPENGGPCTASSDSCVCLIPQGVCVECTADDTRNCSAAEPTCGADNLCRACGSNDECASGACLEDGACAPASRIVYASPNGVNTPGCGRAPGAEECSLAQAMLEISAPRDILRLAPGAYVVPSTTVDGLDFTRSATLVARGATLSRSAPSGAIVSVRGDVTLKLVGGTLRGPSNTTDGIKCKDGGLLVHEATIEGMTQSGIGTESCELTVSRSTIRNNAGVGINMINLARTATITNNFVYRNGSSTSVVGGMALRLATGSKLELNTIVDNTASLNAGSSGGVTCDLNGYDAPFNLVYRNQGGLGGQVQVLGACTFQGSYQQGAMPGENAVGFENPNGATPSYRLTPASPPGTIRDAFDCNGIDFERDPRPSPSAAMMGKCDHGADEYRAGQ
jgi:hypothetical protein